MANRFDQHASVWDAKEYRTKLAQDVSHSIRQCVTLTPETDLLDFGCGTGLISLPFATEVRSLTGLDTSEGMLAVFLEKARQAGLTNVKGILADLAAGAITQDRFGLIVSSMTFHHVADVPALLSRMHRMLVPGGQLAVADLDPDEGLFHSDNDGVEHFGFEREAMEKMFTEAGFLNVSATTAATLFKEGGDGILREFTIFLVTGVRG